MPFPPPLLGFPSAPEKVAGTGVLPQVGEWKTLLTRLLAAPISRPGLGLLAPCWRETRRQPAPLTPVCLPVGTVLLGPSARVCQGAGACFAYTLKVIFQGLSGQALRMEGGNVQ